MPDALPEHPGALSRPTQLRRIRAERNAYRDDVLPPDPGWPVDVRAVMRYVQEHLFKTDLTAGEVKQACGAYNHNISTRFAWYAGEGIKSRIITHRLALAKRLLQYDKLKITEVALAVGYDSPSAFTMAFQRRVGHPPSAHRKMLRES